MMAKGWKCVVSVIMGLLLAIGCSVRAEDIRGTLAMPDRSVVPTTKVALNGGQRTALTARDGSFVFRDVAPGVYLLEVLSTTFHYSAMKIKLDEKTGIIAIEYKYPGAPRKEAIHPLLLTAHTKWKHFDKKEGVKIGGYLKNPMMIMMVLSFGMMFFLPKMMAGLDPEQLEEIKGQQKAVADSASSFSLSDMLTNVLSGSAAQPPTAPQQPQAASQAQRSTASHGSGRGSGSRGKKKHS